MNQLVGFYQALLTDKQQEMLQLYYEEDFSLAEIADHYHISRQAVRDNLKRSEKAMEQYETQLQLIARREQRAAYFQQLAPYIPTEAQDIWQALQEMDQ